MDAYSQNFQLLAKSFFGCQYSNFVNLYLKLGVETQEDIILILFGGRPCKTAIGLYYVYTIRSHLLHTITLAICGFRNLR